MRAPVRLPTRVAPATFDRQRLVHGAPGAVLSLGWLPAALWSLALAGAALYTYVFVKLAIRRVPYSFELDVTEGSLLGQVHRISAGQPLYTRPTLEYAPNIYPPLYYYVSALFATVLGSGFTSLRLVSVLATVGCAVLIYATVVRESRRQRCALLAAGFFFGTFRVSGAWLDNARVDSLALFLSLAAIYVVRFHEGTRGTVAGAAVTALALETKQTASFLVAALWLYLLLARGWRVCGQFSVTLGGVFAAAYLGLQATSGGLVRVLRVPAAQPA